MAIVSLACALLSGGTATAASAADRDRDGLRDGWERRYGVSEPDRRDTDRDGVIDAAEDPDLDRLGNLGEQRFGTDPGHPDSDGDGIIDGNEDSDRDGRSDALEQDQRPLPASLIPSLDEAPTAYPRARADCQTHDGKADLRLCVFGDRRSATDIVLFGDSHATQWLPALARAAGQAGWRVVMITKSGCPSADAMPASQVDLDDGETCGSWRAGALAWLRRNPPDFVIVTNMSRYQISEADWQAGLRRTLASLPSRSTAIVLADTPRQAYPPVSCLRERGDDISACVTARMAASNPDRDRMEYAAARAAGAEFMNLGWKVCPYDPCPLVIGETLIWRDHGHLTAAFSRQLAPSMRQKLDAILARVAAVKAAKAAPQVPGDPPTTADAQRRARPSEISRSVDGKG